MALIVMVIFLILGIGLYLIIVGSVLPFGLTIANIAFGVMLILYSIALITATIADNE